MELPKTPSFRLDGRRALVTGASSGIGLGCAAALADAGADVVIAARGAEKLAAVGDAMRAQGWSVTDMALDAGDLEVSLPRVSDAGPFDILINNAGMARNIPMRDTTPADFDAVVDINLRGAYFLARQVAEDLVAAERPGVILNMSSQMGHVGGRDRTVYCATKHGIEGLTKAMCIEYASHGIRVNTIGPTFVRTPLTAPTFADPDKAAWVMSKIKLGRVAEVQDLMGAVVFLCSDAAAMITGTHLIVDGGWTAD